MGLSFEEKDAGESLPRHIFPLVIPPLLSSPGHSFLPSFMPVCENEAFMQVSAINL
jgi:hypothetical protein